MRTVEITRTGNASIVDQIAEMREWLRGAGIEPGALEPLRILNADVSFRATFATDDDATRFCRRFGLESATDPV